VKLTAVGLALAVCALHAEHAQASQEFPGALYEEADMQCVPLCNMCHTVNPGTAGTWTRPVGAGVKAKGAKAGDPESLKAAFAKYKLTLDAATLEKIRSGHEPSTGLDVCAPTYGCAVTQSPSPQPKRDRTTPLLVVGAALLGGLLRRRRPAR
jgi:MYXO-CTERM domain-containing protein